MSSLIETKVFMDSLHENRVGSIRGFLRKRHKEQYSRRVKAAWCESAYDLDKISFYNELGNGSKRAILENLSQDRIEEAYHIEKSGMAYGAKMILLSESLEERELYSFFTGDEARHFEMISRHLDREPNRGKEDTFLTFLSSIIEKAPKKTLVFLIQVLLEGWGLTHYKEMADTCLDQELRANLNSILLDEVAHHESGVILFDEKTLNKEEREYIVLSLKHFLNMVQIGPHGIITRLIEQNSLLGKKHIIQSLEEMKAREVTQKKLDSLSYLMKKAGAFELMQVMEHQGYLKAYDCDQMANSFS